MKVKCDKCGNEYVLEKGENPEDFQCDCGGNLKSLFDIKKNKPQPKVEKTKSSGGGFTDWWNKQNSTTKAGLGIGGICCIGLIIVLAIFAMGGSDKNTQNLSNNNTPTNTQQPTTAQATWHSIQKTSGSGTKNTPAFTIKGSKFKVKYTATAAANATQYAKLSIHAYPEGETTNFVGWFTLDNFSQNTMTDESEVTASPGNYYLDVGAANLASWTVEVFDYY